MQPPGTPRFPKCFENDSKMRPPRPLTFAKRRNIIIFGSIQLNIRIAILGELFGAEKAKMPDPLNLIRVVPA